MFENSPSWTRFFSLFSTRPLNSVRSRKAKIFARRWEVCFTCSFWSWKRGNRHLIINLKSIGLPHSTSVHTMPHHMHIRHIKQGCMWHCTYSGMPSTYTMHNGSLTVVTSFSLSVSLCCCRSSQISCWPWTRATSNGPMPFYGQQ